MVFGLLIEKMIQEGSARALRRVGPGVELRNLVTVHHVSGECAREQITYCDVVAAPPMHLERPGRPHTCGVRLSASVTISS